ncbi:hypothetical protein [Hydrogenothermus marinus]|uniref:Uncharacterized protein n=1 Tax=Hydrogenothermus marinus TaxID=133270 RepID=A0A3M0C3H7_9AQUI|nr:hypothetical protein [Hydrogenothermus marinus]RMA97522.1 hypothetical protein CLV39_0135 [Hydrogenothermus marinus]
MADFTKAGSDRGDFEKQLKHHLISANYTYHAYMANIDDLTEEELKADLEEYLDQISMEIIPLIKMAESLEEEKFIEKALKIKEIYNNLVDEIKARLETK